MKNIRRKDGFEGQKLISLPVNVVKNALHANPFLQQLHITHIGYFPKAHFHFRERRTGCADNIFIYCLHGKGWYIAGDKKYEVSANEYIHLPATRMHLRYGADEKDPWTIFWVHFSGSDMPHFNQVMNIAIDDGPKKIPHNEKGLAIWETMYNSLDMGYSTENICNANFCLYQFVASFLFSQQHIYKSAGSEQDIITNSIHYMKEHTQSRLTVADIALKYDLSASYFSSLFRKATGMPPVDYFIHLKMQKACQMLYMEDIKVKEVARTLGYDDPYYFSRLFKKYMSASPEQYRQELRTGK